MNQKEARNLNEALRQLRHGPNSGWKSLLAGRELGPFEKTIEERNKGLQLWLDTWIIPPIEVVVARYGRKSR